MHSALCHRCLWQRPPRTETPPHEPRPPWTETPLDRDPLDRDPLPGQRTWDTSPPWTDKYLWKHYLLHPSYTGGKNTAFSLFRVYNKLGHFVSGIKISSPWIYLHQSRTGVFIFSYLSIKHFPSTYTPLNQIWKNKKSSPDRNRAGAWTNLSQFITNQKNKTEILWNEQYIST